MSQFNQNLATVINAPSRPNPKHKYSIFLAGTTTPNGQSEWREILISKLSIYPIVIFNPLRSNWDSTWREDFSDPRWVEQVNWELDMQDNADLVVFFFHDRTDAPISLLEFGLCARSGRALVYASEGYSKRGNVDAVCRRFGATLFNNEDDLVQGVVGKFRSLGIDANYMVDDIMNT